MSDLRARFDQAAEEVQSLNSRPDNATLLKLYALFKQGSMGDASGNRPGMTQFAKRAKFDAWSGLKGTSRDDAMTRYIALVEQLKG